MIIYLVTNIINNKQYVGQTIQTIEKRWRCHQTKGHALFCAIKKYGVHNFTIEQLDIANNIEELNIKEQEWIRKLNSVAPNGYNLRLGGDSGGRHSNETKEKISKAGMGRVVSEKTKLLKREQMSGEKNPMFGKTPNLGKHHSEETKLKISTSGKGKKRSEETCKRIGESKKGVSGWKKGLTFGHESNRKNQFEFHVFNKNGEFVGTWNNQRICAKDLNIPYKGISGCLNGVRPSHKGYVFNRGSLEQKLNN